MAKKKTVSKVAETTTAEKDYEIEPVENIGITRQGIDTITRFVKDLNDSITNLEVVLKPLICTDIYVDEPRLESGDDDADVTPSVITHLIRIAENVRLQRDRVRHVVEVVDKNL